MLFTLLALKSNKVPHIQKPSTLPLPINFPKPRSETPATNGEEQEYEYELEEIPGTNNVKISKTSLVHHRWCKES